MLTFGIHLIAFAIAAASCFGQETPRYIWNATNAATSFRTSFCERHGMVEAGYLTRREALQDMEVRPVLYGYQLDTESGGIPESGAGISILFMDELAKRVREARALLSLKALHAVQSN